MATEPVYRDWEQLLEQRVNLYKNATINGDAQLIAMLRAQDELSEVDHVATLYNDARSLGPHVLDDVDQTMTYLENYIQDSNKDLKASSEGIKRNWDFLAQGDSNQDNWEQELETNVAAEKEKSAEAWDGFLERAKDKIKKLPQKVRAGASKVATGAMGAYTDFARKVQGWLEGALGTVAQWLANAWGKIKEWAVATKNWFTGAWNTVRGWFGGGRLTGVRRRGSDRAKSEDRHSACDEKALLDFDGIAAKLQDVDLDKFFLCRQGSATEQVTPMGTLPFNLNWIASTQLFLHSNYCPGIETATWKTLEKSANGAYVVLTQRTVKGSGS